jgi:hypothetical protein
MKKITVLFLCFFVSKINADTVINGYDSGNLILGAGSELIIENNTTTTLKNLTLKNLSSERLVMEGTGSILALENVTIYQDGDYSFTQGQLFIYDEVNMRGTSGFSYQSAQQSYIKEFSTWYFDINTTFSYEPSVANRTLISMSDATSRFHFNGCDLYSTSTGLQLDTGTVFFDNLVTLSADGQVESEAISFGESDGVVVDVLSGACVEIYGYINFD